jgi:glycosyltransferase involved in cell wall biosynthesis
MVPDVRPYLQHAAVVVAPLRVARGVQNKVLEAMSMARPVVVSVACAKGIDATAGRDYEAAADPDTFVESIDRLLDDPRGATTMGEAARLRVLARYSWKAHLSRIDAYLEPRGRADAA